MTERLGSFDRPDEVIELELLRSEIVHIGGLAVSRTTHLPGWRWKDHVQPFVGGEWCQTRHVGISVSGWVHIVLASGSEFDLRQGMVFDVPPGHTAWVLGDEPYVDITWTGARTWLPPSGPEPERVLATVLFTDIVESTVLARSLGDRRWADLISTFEERVRDTLGRFGGREIKTTGDGVLALFTGASRAVRCGLALREVALELELRLRVALHTGEIDLAGEDVRGVAVHEASRILGLAAANQIVVSDRLHDLVDGAEFEFELLGAFELRGLPGQRRLYGVV
jgi:class 3 adenylate cyclase